MAIDSSVAPTAPADALRVPAHAPADRRRRGEPALLFSDEEVSRLMKPETAYFIGLAPVA